MGSLSVYTVPADDRHASCVGLQQCSIAENDKENNLELYGEFHE